MSKICKKFTLFTAVKSFGIFVYCISTALVFQEKKLQLGKIKAVRGFSTERSGDVVIELSVLAEFINFICIC